MLVGILSDTHDNLNAIAKVVERFNEKQVGAVLHAGDLVAPFTAKPLQKLTAPLHIVFGNNDGERLGLKNVYGEQIHIPPYQIKLDDKKIVLMHEPDNLSAIIDSGHFDLIVYGHLHEIDIRKEKTLVVNPGECGGWVSGKSTVAIWNTISNEVDIEEL